MKYDFAAIEKKWQDKWEQVKPYAAVTGDKRPKFYGLERLWQDGKSVDLSGVIDEHE